jgi:predicted O-methyltransferase YrrM
MNSAIHACKFFLTLDSPETQVSDVELDCLLSFASSSEVIVEIGCYEGKTTAALANQSRGRVYAIDPFFKGRLGLCYGELIARRYCRRQGLKNVEFIRALSYEAAVRFEKPIDFLFIDADHRYEAVKRDWDDWFPKVRSGGIIALHDSRVAPNSPDYLGSMKFYDEDLPIIAGITELDGPGSLAVFQVT